VLLKLGGNYIWKLCHSKFTYPTICARLHEENVFFLSFFFFFNYVECAYINPFFLFYIVIHPFGYRIIVLSQKLYRTATLWMSSNTIFAFFLPISTIPTHINIRAPTFGPFCSSFSLSLSMPLLSVSFVAIFVTSVIRFHPGWWGD
jgi:hypothetical protein